jgi:hypothetical protein
MDIHGCTDFAPLSQFCGNEDIIFGFLFFFVLFYSGKMR